MTEIKLPPLPEKRTLGWSGDRYDAYQITGYDEDDLEDFAREAIALNATPTGMEAPAAEPVPRYSQPQNPAKTCSGSLCMQSNRCEYVPCISSQPLSHQPVATPPTGEVKPEADAQTLSECRLRLVAAGWEPGHDSGLREALALAANRVKAPEVKPAPALVSLINDYGRACRRDGNPAWESNEGQALKAALAAQEKPNAPALSAQPAEPLTKEQVDFILADAFLAANGSVYATRVYDFVAAVEAAHGICPQPQPPHQEAG